MAVTSSFEDIETPDVELQGRRFPALWDAPRLRSPTVCGSSRHHLKKSN